MTKLYFKKSAISPLKRIRLWYALLIFILAVFVVRLFDLQILKHDYYKKAALTNQLKQYEIPAERGEILIHYGDKTLPIVLNEVKYTLFADPKFITDVNATATAIKGAIGGDENEYKRLMSTHGSRYEILAKKLSRAQHEQISALKLKGIGTQPANYRTYPQGSLAAQLLGFVNDEGKGNYGIEQALDDTLKGKPGQLKAITDIKGVPLEANQENLLIRPKPGRSVVLTLDLSMQSQLEDILKEGLDRARSASGSALIVDVNTGAIKAMANFPTYNPADFQKVEKAELFTNPAVSSPLEIGSVMKPFTTAAALDKGVVKPDTTYYDPSFWRIDGFNITNIEEAGGAGTRSVAQILQKSLNTGATWLLMQLGGGEINENARKTWHDYMTNHYRFGKLTGVEQGYEAEGSIPDPMTGYGLNLQYANTSFGQGMTATPLQVASALSSIVNGGTYYKPRLVDMYLNGDGTKEAVKPSVVAERVISPSVSADIVSLMKSVVDKNYLVYKINKPSSSYVIGGKTGTAQIPHPAGGYYQNKFNGMFMGFVGGEKPVYAIVVRVNEPGIGGYAGSQAAAPIFGQLSAMLINNFGIKPKG